MNNDIISNNNKIKNLRTSYEKLKQSFLRTQTKKKI